MKKIFVTALLFLSSPAFAADCIQNDYNEKVCVGDITFPAKQKVVRIDSKKEMVIVQESNGSFTAYSADSVRVQPKNRLGYSVGQVLSNSNLVLQIADLTYTAQLNPELDASNTSDFRRTETFWRTTLKPSSAVTAAISLKTAKAEAYSFLFRRELNSNRIHASQVDLFEAQIAETDTTLQISSIPFNVKVIEIHPVQPTITVAYQLNGKTRKATMFKSELDLFSSATSTDQFLDGCSQIRTCEQTLRWGG